MKKDLIGIIKDVSRFIGYHMTELQVLRLDDHLYIDNFRQVVCEGMRGDPTMKDFIRKGKVGDWKNYFSGSNLQFWDQWIAEHIQGTDIVFPEHWNKSTFLKLEIFASSLLLKRDIFNWKIIMCRKKTAPCPFLTQIKSPNITSGQAYAQPKYTPAQKWSREVSQSILRLPRGMLVLSKPQQKERLSYKN